MIRWLNTDRQTKNKEKQKKEEQKCSKMGGHIMKQFLFGNYVGWDFDLNILLMHTHLKSIMYGFRMRIIFLNKLDTVYIIYCIWYNEV